MKRDEKEAEIMLSRSQMGAPGRGGRYINTRIGGEKEKMKGRKKLEAIVIAAIIAVSIIAAMIMPVSAQISGDVTTTGNDKLIKADTTEKFNFTITDNLGAPHYITYINITRPEDFTFVLNTNGSTIASDFDVVDVNLTWEIIGTSFSGTTNYFWFNATAPASLVNNTTYTWDTYATHNNSQVDVNKTFNVTVIENTLPVVTIDTPTTLSPVYRKGGDLFYVNFTYAEWNPKNYTVEVGNSTNVINTTTVDYPSGGINQVASKDFYLNSTAADGVYNVTVTMYDNASNYVVSYQNNSVVKDDTPPTVTEVSPANESTGVAATTTISATFNEAMNETSAQSAFSVDSVSGTFSWAGSTMTFTPGALEYNTLYTVTINASIAKDLAGNLLDGNASGTADGSPADDYTWSFTTGSAPSVRRGGGRAAPSLGPGETAVSTEPTGEVTSTVTALSADEKAVVTIYKETIAKDAAGNPLTKVTVTSPSELPTGVPSGANYVGYAYDFGPEGATFSKPVEISITFDPADFPAGTTPMIYVYEAGRWKALATTLDWANNKANAEVTHFSTFVLFAEEKVKVTPTPTATPTPTPTATPSPTPTPTPEEPGFEAVFAIAGLLATAYLVLRRKKSVK